MKYLSILSVLLLIGGNFSFAMEDIKDGDSTRSKSISDDKDSTDKSDIHDENKTNIPVSKDDDYFLQLKNKYQVFFNKNKQYILRILLKHNKELTIDFLEYMKENKLDKRYFNIYYYFEWLMKNYIIDHVRWLLKKKAEKDNVEYKDKSDDEIEKFFMQNAALVQKLTDEFYEEFDEELRQNARREIDRPDSFWNTVD